MDSVTSNQHCVIEFIYVNCQRLQKAAVNGTPSLASIGIFSHTALMRIKYMYSIKHIDIYGITPVCTGRTRPFTVFFNKINAFGTLTGTSRDLQVALSKN